MTTTRKDRASKRSRLRTTALMLLLFGLSAAAAANMRAFWKTPADSLPVVDENSLTRRGRLLFAVHCATCHGPEGHGDGPAAASLKMPPPDFAAGWKHGTSLESLRRLIAQGIPGTAMPAATPSLSAGDLDAVVAFVHSLGARQPANRLADELRKAGFAAEETPSAAPQIDLRNAKDGAAVTLGDFKGKTVLLCFWSTDCSPCLKQLPHLQRLSHRFAASGFAVVAVCADETEGKAAESVARRFAGDLTIFVDPDGLTRLRFGVQAFPTSVLIDSEGRILGRLPGAADWSGPTLSDFVGTCLNPSTRR
jgi:mono/diheme cytochrome c family protein/peroxiredoxin